MELSADVVQTPGNLHCLTYIDYRLRSIRDPSRLLGRFLRNIASITHAHPDDLEEQGDLRPSAI